MSVKRSLIGLLDRASLQSHFARLCKEDRKYNTTENEIKLAIVGRLVERQVLQDCTQGYLADWLAIRLPDLHRIEKEAIKIGLKYRRVYAETPIDQECHAIASLFWALDTRLEIYTGMSDGVNYHSWLIDGRDKRLIEPTPIIRNHYHGFRVHDPIDFMLAETENVIRLGEKGLLPRAVFNRYLSVLKNLL